MSRLNLRLASIVAISTAICIAGCGPNQEPASSTTDQQTAHADSQQAQIPQPNILLVMADDMGWTDIGGV